MTTYPNSEKPSTKRKPRRKMLVRAKGDDLPGMQLMPRDLAILHGVYTCRALTTAQIQRRYFPADEGSLRGATVRCQQRLKLLFHHGYLQRDEQPVRLQAGRLPLVYFLAKRGAEVLADYLKVELKELDWHPRDALAGASQPFINHLLHTNDVRIAVECAAETQGYQVTKWLDERSLRRRQMKEYVDLVDEQGRQQKVAVVPDGYFAVQKGNNLYHHFLEIDLRTTIGLSAQRGRRDWVRRVRSYEAYHQSGRYQVRYEAQTFRVLTVTTGERRLANLRAITEKAGGKARFWFTTFAAIERADPLTAPIWQVAQRNEPLSLIF